MDKKSVRSNILLLLAAAIWGLAFVAQSDGMKYIGPFTFGAARCFLGVIALIPAFIIFSRINDKGKSCEEISKKRKTTVKVGAVCGAILFVAISSQQIGLQYTTAGKAGFITALYIVLVPVFGKIFFHKKTSILTWLSVAIATVGLYLLCMKENFSISKGDLWVMVCAVVFAVQILIVDRYVDKVDGVLLSLVQFAVVTLLSVPFIFINHEQPSVETLSSAWVSICYTGILSCGAAYTFQILGQKDAKNPTIASLLMSMESVTAAIFGWLILHERLDKRELIGVVLMFCAVVIAQLPSPKKKAKAKETVF